MVERFDVVVVGGGPAGAAAALAARRARPDARVALLDRADFPRDKACGDGVAGAARAELAALGVPTLLDDWPTVDRLEVEAPSGTVAAGAATPPNWVVPRRELDARLVAAAVSAGAELHRHKAVDVTHAGAAVVVDGRFAAPVLIGADGAHSAIRRHLGLPANRPRWTGVAIRAYAPATRPAQLIRMLDERWPAYAWAFPVGDGTANVGVGALADRLPGGRRALVDWLRSALPEADFDPATVRGHPLPLWAQRPAVAHGRVLLAGDAASLINPLSGEGILAALRSGRLAGHAAVADRARVGRAYRRALRAALGRHVRPTGALARLVADRGLVEAAVAVCGDRPARFGQLSDLTVADGCLPPSTLAAVVARRLAAPARRHDG